MSFSETIFLFVLALIIFGPKKLPEIARQVGKYMNEFRRASNEFKSQIEQEIAHLDVEKQTILPPAKSPEGATSRNATFAGPVDAAPSSSPANTPTPAPADEPLFAAQSAAEATTEPPVATEALPESNVETPSSPRESHV